MWLLECLETVLDVLNAIVWSQWSRLKTVTNWNRIDLVENGQTHVTERSGILDIRPGQHPISQGKHPSLHIPHLDHMRTILNMKTPSQPRQMINTRPEARLKFSNMFHGVRLEDYPRILNYLDERGTIACSLLNHYGLIVVDNHIHWPMSIYPVQLRRRPTDHVNHAVPPSTLHHIEPGLKNVQSIKSIT